MRRVLCNRLCAWLRTAGVELGDAGKRLSVEGRERVSQRRMLHDEIHALRQERDSLQGRVDELEDELLQTKNSGTAALKRREAELEEARKQLAEVTERVRRAHAGACLVHDAQACHPPPSPRSPVLAPTIPCSLLPG